MLEHPEVFSEDFIVDELIDFLAAGTQTSQMSAQTVLSHFATDKDSLSKVRNELSETLNGRDLLSLNHDDCQDLTYLSYVI